MTTCSRADAGASFNYPFLTLKERDIETGLDFFEARYYSSTQGRFTSADEPFAGQDEEDPQTWNLYSYTSNNPLNRVDEDGRRWFYKTGEDGTDVQWVNPNEDGTYTSPGEGWNEFVPTANSPFLYLSNEDGTRTLFLGEKSDGSPDVRNLWNGKSEDASWDIVELFIPGRIGAKGILAGATALWGKHLAQKAAREGAQSAVERLINLSGKTKTEARQVLEKTGFKNKGTTPGGYEKWYHPDGSKVQIRPNGEVIRTPKGGKGWRVDSDGNKVRPHTYKPERLQ